MSARQSSVVAYLVKHHGLKREKAEEICEAHKDKIERGVALGSYDYYIATEVGKAALEAAKLEEYPTDWSDPNWVQPEDEEEADTDDGC